MSEHASNAVAVIGMACNFPGAADLAQYWALLSEGRCAVTQVGEDRWDNEQLFSAQPGASGKLATRWAGQIDSYDAFDYEFFNLSKAEASNLDPQQLLALETAWRAIEHARLRPSALAGKNVGVFVGASSSDFESIATRERGAINALTATGINTSIIAARISYVLDFKGPCMTINTACSSSLVALHEACLHLQSGQCDVAVAGGVNLILRPETTIAVSQAGMMAPDGRCKTFDDDANGYVRGEGCGMVLLKPLQKALDDGDRILGVIRGSAVNHDGRSNGITAPSRFAQEALIGAALARAGVAPDQVTYIEAHGTGTRLGDPIEVNALKTVYGAQANGPACHIGSVKANIGHLESAAGIAGLIKVLLQIEHKTIVRQIGISQLNRYIHLDRTRLRIALENRDWADHGTAVCAVSSFSFGGTNAHVLVACPPERAQPAADEGGPLILAISGRTPTACDSLAQACLAQLPAHRQPARFCASVAQTRDHFAYRRAVVALDAAQLAQALAQDAAPARQGAADAPSVAFLFSGQASQYATMGLHLYRQFELFRHSIDGANVLFHRFHGCTMQDVLWGDKSALLDRTEYTQPALYVLQVALARLWQSLGITPSLVIGHSIGEYAAAHIAGVFSFNEGLEMVLLRADLMQRLGPEGNMLAIRADRQRVQAILAPCAASYQFAVFNSDGDVVISVRPQAVGQLVRLLTDAGIHSIVLKGSRPFHSDLMQAAAREFHAKIAHVGFRAPAIDMVDNISAGNDAHSAFDAGYWMRQIVAPVDFAGCVRHPRINGIDVVLEIGPGSTLLALFAKAGGTRQRPLLPSMLVSDKNAMTFFKAVGQLYEAGAEIDWATLQSDGRFVDVPGYPFERKKIFSAADPRFVPVPAGAGPAPVYELGWQSAPTGASRAPCLVLSDGHYSALAGSDAVGATTAAAALHYVTSRDFVNDAADGQGDFSSRALDGLVHRIGAGPIAVAICWDFLANVDASSGADHVHTALRLTLRLIARYGDVKSIAFILPAASGYAGLTGALRSLQLEVGAIYLKTVTVEDMRAGPVDTPLLDLLRLGASGDFLYGARGGMQRVLRPRPAQPVHAPAIRPERSYLITGGTGSIGLAVAEGLVQRGARQIILMSRQGVRNEHDRRRIDRLGAAGGELHVLLCDVADPVSVERALDSLAATMLPLAGVFHAAGTVTLRAGAELERADFADAQCGKVGGAINLLRHLEGIAFDFFVSFSSVSSLWGAAGLAHYAAANASLDALTEQQRHATARFLTINWGPWSHSHMVPQEAVGAMEQAGIRQMRPDTATGILFGLLDQRAHGRFAVCDVDWDRLAALYSVMGADALFAPLLAAPPAQARQRSDAPAGAAATSHSADEIKAIARGAVAALLGTSVDEIGDDDSLHELGIDSLLAIELKRALEAKLGMPLPATMVFDFPTIAAIAGLVLSKLKAAPLPEAPVASTVPAQQHDVAIVGVACRLPGEVETLDAFWDLLASKQDVIVDTHARWDSDLFAPSSGSERRKHFGAGLLSDIESFDARLFGITPVEAAQMDPQQRIGLELAWRCFESAGYRPSTLSGKNIGIYVGVASNEYSKLCRQEGQGSEYLASGNALNVIAGRIAYQFGLTGPAIAIDTACSSSLVAIHQAVRAVRHGDCEMALAAGVNVMLDYDIFVSLDQAKMLSPRRRCATFDDAADGYVRAEGGGMLLLKPLSMAERDGDAILAVIKGSAINQDGRSASLTAPNGVSQEEVIRAALKDARLAPAAVDWIEAHGTGTPLGDPIEMQALDRVYGVEGGRLLVGAVKSNIGHLESASGMAGVIKVIASLQREAIPPNLHFQDLNKHLYQLKAQLVVPTTPIAWRAGPAGQSRTAAVSSFGFSGTNAHVLIQEYAQAPVPARLAWDLPQAHLLLLSAASPGALHKLVRAAGRAEPGALGRLCAQAATLRDHHRYRTAFVARDGDALSRMLQTASQRDAVKCKKNRRALFVIGSDEAMLRHTFGLLYDVNLEFKSTFDVLVARLTSAQKEQIQTLSAKPYACSEPSPLFDFVIQCAWHAMWRSLGVGGSHVVPGGSHSVLRACLDGTATFEACVAQLGMVRPDEAAASLDADAVARHLQADGAAIVLSIGVPERSPLRRASTHADGVRWHDAGDASRSDNAWYDALAALYDDGFAIAWERVYPRILQGQTLCCPVYPFDRKRHWVRPALSAAPAGPASADPLLRSIRSHTATMHEQIDFLLQACSQTAT